MKDLFAQVILPLPLHNAYSYKVPLKWHSQISTGQRVVVQFGARKIYSALVFSLTHVPPEDVETKEVLELLDEKPVILPPNLELWKWISSYYSCTLGDVFKAAIPPGLRLESKSKLMLNDSTPESDLSEKEQRIL